MRFCEGRSVEQGTEMAVVKAPVCDVLVLARSFKPGSELRADLAAVTVAKLVEDAAILVENPMECLDQLEIPVAREEAIAGPLAQRRIVRGEPRCPVGVVVHRHRILGRHLSGQHFHLDRHRRELAASVQNRFHSIASGRGVGGDPDIQPERLRRLVRNAIVGFGQLRAILRSDRDQSVGIVVFRLGQIVEPLAIEFHLQTACTGKRAGIQAIITRLRHNRKQVTGNERRSCPLQGDGPRRRRAGRPVSFDNAAKRVGTEVLGERQEIASGATERPNQDNRETRKGKKSKLTAAWLHGKTRIYNLSQISRSVIRSARVFADFPDLGTPCRAACFHPVGAFGGADPQVRGRPPGRLVFSKISPRLDDASLTESLECR